MLLRDHPWEFKYDSDSESMIEEFYVPALSCAKRYDRTTGYFSSRLLTLASRGVEALLSHRGRMRLVVGCTLDTSEVEAIKRGEELKGVVSERLKRDPLEPQTPAETDALELLSWMVASGFLEVKVAIPRDTRGHLIAGNVLFHPKVGIVEDAEGDRLAFNGGVNETAQGWAGNWDSISVFTSWAGGMPWIDAEELTFAKLWADKAAKAHVVDIPQAVREDLLRFLPPQDRKPKRLVRMYEQLNQRVDYEVDENIWEPQREPPAQEAEPQLDSSELQRLLWGLIKHAPSLPEGGDLVGEATSAVVPWPHQVRAFERMYRPWSGEEIPPKLLIADEVGLGKTIEAGMLLRQAWLSGKAKRVLVLAPKSVLTQWQIELREKFNLYWPIYDGQKLIRWRSEAQGGPTERKVDRSTWHHQPCVITSSHLMRRKDRARELLEEAEPWDLVILDEAHHARRKGAGSTKDKGPNQLLGLMRELRNRTKGLVLLTATPMQVHPVEVWDLLDLLGLPSGWTAPAFLTFFDKAMAPNPSNEELEWLASFFREVEERYGPTEEDVAQRVAKSGSKLRSRKILRALRDPATVLRKRLNLEDRRAALAIMRANTPVARLISRHTRELLRAYAKAGKLSSRIAERSVQDRFVEMTSAEREVYRSVEDYISTTYDQASPKERNAVGFVMTIYRRRLASSFRALAATLSTRSLALDDPEHFSLIDEDDLEDDEARDEAMDSEEGQELEFQALVAEEQDDITALLCRVRGLPADTKTKTLVTVLGELRAMGYEQMMVFTQYTDTMDFLRDHLSSIKLGMKVMCYSGRGGEIQGPGGSWQSISRDEAKRRFREGGAEVLLCTDAAAEGLNFQFCGALVNYDMPWNPMKVEQRIGRIDRLGQRYEKIQIVNLHYQDTVESDVYCALRDRIELFNKFVGRLQPILSTLSGSITRIALSSPAERDQRKAELISTIGSDIDEADRSGFDLDEVSAADLEQPPRPQPAFDLDDLDRLINQPDLLPPGFGSSPLGPREYTWSMPGLQTKAIRVTTDREYFEQNSESVELWSPGSSVFPEPEDGASRDDVEAAGRTLKDLLKAKSG
jgi:SNF2 family DNA or RNA helicase